MIFRKSFILLLLYFSYDCICIQLPGMYSFFDNNIFDNVSDCDTALRNFASSSSNLTYCMVRYSHPIHVCELCVDNYMDVLKAHESILTAEVNGTKCKDKLINVDRLQVVETTFNQMQDMWKKGYCDKCFDWKDGVPTLSNQTKLFIQYFETTKQCIVDHINQPDISNNTDKICKECMDVYVILNSFYESLKGTSETVGICMDIVDSMNATRSIWSDVLNCCRLRRTPEVVFLVCTGIITALPAVFYLLAKVYCENSKPKLVGQNRLAEALQCPPSTSRSSRY